MPKKYKDITDYLEIYGDKIRADPLWLDKKFRREFRKRLPPFSEIENDIAKYGAWMMVFDEKRERKLKGVN